MVDSWLLVSHQEALLPAERCLPVSGAASEAHVVVTGVYTDSKLHGLLVGNITWPKSPEELDKELKHWWEKM